MPKTLNSEYEAIFAAAAHHLISRRLYHEAEKLLSVMRCLRSPYDPAKRTVKHLNAVRELCALLFSGYLYVGELPKEQMRELVQALDELDSAIQREIRAVRRPRKKIETFYDWLEVIEKRPGLYLGTLSLERLWWAMHPMRPPRFVLEEKPSFNGFIRWIDRRYSHLQGGGSGWHMILASAAGGDGPKALKLFFKELRSYRKAAGGSCAAPHPRPAKQREKGGTRRSRRSSSQDQ